MTLKTKIQIIRGNNNLKQIVEFIIKIFFPESYSLYVHIRKKIF